MTRIGASRGSGAGQFFITASFLAAAGAVWVIEESTPIGMVMVSLAIGAAGTAAFALHQFLFALAGRAPRVEAITDTTRASLEREKLLALRALKDLEFDKAMGKVSAADAAPLEARLRDRAMTIMRELDGRALLRARIEADAAALQAGDERPETRGPESAALSCASCGTANDADARFCKGCGAKL